MEPSALPLTGIKVLDLTTSYAGPFCTMLLGDMGADVVKIEEPTKGDDSRYWGPPFTKAGVSPWFLSTNRNKRSMALDIRDPNGMVTLRQLIQKADVFVVSLGLKALERLKLTYTEVRALNPAIIFCSITGFGQTGPYRSRPCYDLISEGIGGVMSVTGNNDQPEKIGTAAGDILAAHHVCFAVVSCLYRRTFTGDGDFVDVNLVESILSFITPRMVSYLATGELPSPDANRSTPIAIYQPIKTKDGYLNMGIGNDRIWERTCNLLGLDDLLNNEDYRTNELRKIHRDEIVAHLEKALAMKDTQYWFEHLSENGVPCGPIYYLNQVAEDPHIKSREAVFYIDEGNSESIPQVTAPWRLTQTEHITHRPPPKIGEHTKEVLDEWLDRLTENKPA